MRPIPFLQTALAVVTFSCAIVSAQDPVTDPKTKEATRGVRFVCAAIAPNTPETLKISGKNGLVDVALSVRSPGEVFPVPADGSVVLGIPATASQPAIKPLAIGKLSPDTKLATAILIPVRKQADGTCYRMLLIGDQEVKGGDVYFLNLLSQRCAVKLEGRELFLPTGSPVIHRAPVDKGTHNTPVAITIEWPDRPQQNRWELLTASTWRLMRSRIEICVIYPDQEYKRPAMKGLTLYPSGDETAGK